MTFFRYISLVLTCAFLLLSCGRDEGKVIPRAKLAQIYAEMFLTDQWIFNTPSVRHTADTSLVYEPILNRYGYTTEDYSKTIEVYLNDPERFSRILRSTIEILDDKLAQLHKRKEELDHIAARKKMLEQLRIEVELELEDLMPYLYKEPYVHYYDSVAVEPDSLQMVYRLVNVERSDTTYDGVRMIVRDTVAVRDTLPEAVDTVVQTVKRHSPLKPMGKTDMALM